MAVDSQISAAILGAGLAVAGQRLLDTLWGLQQRKLRHLTALHRLELELNEFYNQSISLHSQIAGFIRLTQRGSLVFELPQPFRVDDSVYQDLIDAETKQRVFDLHTNLGRLNADLENFTDTYVQLRNTHWSGGIDASHLIAQATMMAESLPELERGLNVLGEKVLDLWAYVQVRSERDKTLLLRIREALLGVDRLRGNGVARARAELVARLAESTTRLIPDEEPDARNSH